VIREVTQSLHCLDVCIERLREPASIAIELLEIIDHWLNHEKGLIFFEYPKFRNIQANWLIDNLGSIEAVNDFLCAIDNNPVFVKIAPTLDRSGLGLFDYACLATSRTFTVLPSPNILECSGSEKVLSVKVKVTFLCFVDSSRRHHEDSQTVRRLELNRKDASIRIAFSKNCWVENKSAWTKARGAQEVSVLHSDNGKPQIMKKVL
jgi:hypothetical protein